MPIETQDAVNWALTQTYVDGAGDTHPVTKADAHSLVDKVREYFNAHIVEYGTFSYDDLASYL